MIIQEEIQQIQYYFCIFPKCSQQTRIIEIDLDKKCHNHNQPNLNHIIIQQEFREFLQQQSIQSQIQEQKKLEKYVQKLNQIQDIVYNLIKQLQQQYDDQFKEYLMKIKSILELQDLRKYGEHNHKKFIDDVLHFTIEYDNKNNRDYKQQMIKKCEQFNNFSSIFQDREYYDYIRKENLNMNLVGCQISNNEQYLLTSYQTKMYITNLINKKSSKLQSNDSNFLYCGADSGFVNCFYIKKLKLLHKAKVDKHSIHFLKQINGNQLLVFQKHISSISILDLQNKKLLAHIRDPNPNLTTQIYSLDLINFNQPLLLAIATNLPDLFMLHNHQQIINQSLRFIHPCYRFLTWILIQFMQYSTISIHQELYIGQTNRII